MTNQERFSLAASYAHRYLTCLASAREETRYPRTQSKYAKEGDLAHALLTKCLEDGKDPLEFVGHTIKVLNKGFEAVIDKTMAAAVSQAYDFIIGVKESCSGFLQSEFALSLSWLKPGQRGALDVIIMDPKTKTMHVMDFKYGTGVLVDAEWNEQLLLYAEAARRVMLMFYGPIEHVKLYILQPRRDHYSVWDVTVDKLRDWVNGVALPTVKRIMEGGDLPYVPSEKACKFCRARGDCRALTEVALKTVSEGFGPVNGARLEEPIEIKPTTALSVDEVFACKNAVKLIRLWCDAIDDKAKEYLEVGLADESCGWKLGEATTKRKWLDEDKVDKALGRAGISVEDRRKTTLISPAQVEKKLGSDHYILKKYAVKPKGGVTVIPASDPRESVSPAKGFGPVLV
jgi:hypothetical protein